MVMTMRAALAIILACGACNGTHTGSTDTPDAAGPTADARPDAMASTAASCTDGVSGTWQDITPPDVAAVLAAQTLGGGGPAPGQSWGIATVIFDPSNPSTLYAPADGQGIFKSLDCGGTWARVDNPADKFSQDTGSVYSWAIVVDPNEPQTIYANDGYGTLGVYKSTDGGQNFTQTFTGNLVGPGQGAGMPVTSVFVDGGFVGTIRLDPTNHLHVLVSPHHSCQAPFSGFCLLESFDGAATWTVVSTNIDVANADGPWADLIDATHFLVGGLPDGGLYLSSDAGATWSAASGITSIVYGLVYRSSVTHSYLLPGAGGVIQSPDGVAWTTLSGTPGAIDNSFAGDGTHLWLARAFPGFDTSFYSASESDPSTWTTLTIPTGPIGFMSLAPDSVNQFVYASASYGGLWRYSP
jgi:hypothetical protein